MVFGSVDFAPPSSRTGQAFNVAFNGNWNRQDPVGGSATTLPASTGERSSWNAGIQGRHSAYFGFGILSETSIGVSGSGQESTPFLDLPAGRARVSSVFDDGTTGVQVLTFGGTSFPATRRSTTTTAAMNSLSWFSADNRHRLRLASEIRHDRYTSEQAGNVLGTFTFNSLEDLEANQPASFTRTLSPRESGAGRLAGALSLGDAWRVSDRIQLQLGVRLDGNRYLDRPDHNEEVEQLFGRRNDHVPSGVFVSPRVGFSWSYGRAAEVAGFAGAARAPRATVRGGIGVFQNVPGANLIGPALDQTGLPGAVQQITCVGPAVPVPDWPAYAASPENIPRVCADGSTGTVFADAAPNVSLFAPDFRPARSVRSNLQWSGAILDNRFVATVDATWSRNVDQTSTVDLNFDPTERFALADEGGRPVYVAPSSIVPATGTPAWRDARVASEFSRVTEVRSDLTSETRQLSLRLSPAQFRSGFSWSVAYVLGEMRQQVRGFDNTAGNPFDTEWTAGPMPRHHLVYSLGRNVFDVARLNWFGQFRSGTRFTPMVAGDINGDGYANDRAFVFDPATAADPDLAAAMQSLLDNGSSAARRCLERQLGHLAGRNSCTGPWTSSANLGVVFNPARVRMPQRATLSLNLSNPIGAADLLFNGSNNLRGWGQSIAPDPVLLHVRGFDPLTQRYEYEVNPRFGSTSPATSPFRVPVTLTAMLRFDVGPFRERQSLERQLDRGRRNDAPRLPESIFRTIYGPNVVPNPLAQILRQQDSLALTSVQADSIATLNHWYLVRVDSLWAPVTKRLAELPDAYDTGEAWRQYLWARRATIDMLAQIGPHVRELLTSDQLRRLPPIVAAHLDPRYLATIRSGTGTFAAAGAMPMPAQSAAGVGRMTGDGGGVRATRGP